MWLARLTFGRSLRSISVVLVMLGQDYCLNSGQERMDSMKSWAEGKAGRSVCCVMQSVRVLVMCCGIVLYVSIRSAFMLELRRELGDRFERLDSFEKSSYVLGSDAWEEYSSGLLGLIKDFVLSVWEESLTNTLTFTSLILRMTLGI